MDKQLTTTPELDSIVDSLKKRLGLYSAARELREEILPKILNGTEDEKKIALERLDKKTCDILGAFESKVHAALMESFNYRLYPWVMEFASKTIEEYNCTTELEKAVATMAVNAHIRAIDNSKRLNEHLEMGGTGRDGSRYLEVLSKQTDRATRQFLSAVITLKQLKAPTVDMDIKINTAFVSQNQQVNIGKQDDKTNEAK
jgi:hypothetical protein